MVKRWLKWHFLAFVILFKIGVNAQQAYYFVSFNSKSQYNLEQVKLSNYFSEKSIKRRAKFGINISQQDFPPDSLLVQKVIQKGARLLGCSRWLNGVLILAEPTIALDSIKKMPFVKQVTYAGKYNEELTVIEKKEASLQNEFELIAQAFKTKQKDSVFYGLSQNQIKQIKANELHTKELFGNEVLIAVLDAGFLNVDKLPAFKHLFNQNQILAGYDFVEQNTNVYNDDDHGLAVLSCLAAYEPGKIMGTAPHANYILLRTENAASENLVEEYYWLLGAEFADSCGADIINSSLGYTQHDEKIMGHDYKELDGKTTVVSIAAQIAAEKGILVFVSAGNEGDDPWRFIAAPADAEDVISVAAVDKYGRYAGFSSVGPTADKRLKPDVAAQGRGAAILSNTNRVYLSNGTSYACPILAGGTALLLQKFKETHPQDIKQVLLWSGDRADEPDRFTGYGIPNLQMAYELLNHQLLYGIAFARVINKSLQVILQTQNAQKVRLTVTNPLGYKQVLTVNCNKPGVLNNFIINLPKKMRKEGLLNIEALFLKTQHVHNKQIALIEPYN
jgi:hypothetical protein